MASKNLKCIRCGVCCIMAPCCIDGALNKSGICSYLTIHKEGYTSCRHIKKNGNPFIEGCFLRSPGFEKIYKHEKAMAEKKAGIKLIGIKR